jgi:hypothetical protein
VILKEGMKSIYKNKKGMRSMNDNNERVIEW